MDAGAILHELTHAAGLPTEALQAASAQRAELLPKFLRVIQEYLGQEPAARENPTPLFFIFHLLGEWRERTAYRPLTRLLTKPVRSWEMRQPRPATTSWLRCMTETLSRSSTSFSIPMPSSSSGLACARPSP